MSQNSLRELALAPGGSQVKKGRGLLTLPERGKERESKVKKMESEVELRRRGSEGKTRVRRGTVGVRKKG